MTKDRWRSGIVADMLGYVSERVVVLLLTAVVGVFVARYLGPRNLGLLSYATSVFGLFGPVTLLGMQSVLVREFSTRGDWRPVLTSALASQAPVAVVASVLGFLVIVFSRSFDRDAVALALVLVPVPLLGLSQSLRAYLEAAGRVRQIMVTGMIAAAVASSLKVLGLLMDAPVWAFGAFGTVQAAILFVGLSVAIPGRKRMAAARRHVHREIAGRLVRESWPLLIAGIAVTVYMRADIIMLGLISGDSEAGIYTAAARLSEVWYFVPMAALAAVRPRLNRLFASGAMDRYQFLTQRFMTAATGVSLLAVAAVLIVADVVVRLLYGAEFQASSLVLRVHILASPFVFLGVASSPWFIDRGMTRAVMVRSSVGAGLNVAVNLVLIPRFGALGASIATLCAYALSGVLINGLRFQTRPLFWMQMRSFLFHWPHDPKDSGSQTPAPPHETL